MHYFEVSALISFFRRKLTSNFAKKKIQKIISQSNFPKNIFRHAQKLNTLKAIGFFFHQSKEGVYRATKHTFLKLQKSTDPEIRKVQCPSRKYQYFFISSDYIGAIGLGLGLDFVHIVHDAVTQQVFHILNQLFEGCDQSMRVKCLCRISFFVKITKRCDHQVLNFIS